MSLFTRKFKNILWGAVEAMYFINPSTKTQIVSTFTTETEVTLENPQTVTNATDTDASIAVKLVGDSVYATEFFSAGQTKVMCVSYIGSTSDGTTCTKVHVRGIE